MNIPWATIIAALLPLVTQSLNRGTPEDTVRGVLQDPTDWDKWRLERRVRIELGMRPREWKRQRADVMASVWDQCDACRGPDMIDDIIAEAKD